MKFRKLIFPIIAALMIPMNAFAQSGAEGVFTIHNDTNNNVVVGFYTNDGSGWSDNWLSEDLDPGNSAV